MTCWVPAFSPLTTMSFIFLKAYPSFFSTILSSATFVRTWLKFVIWWQVINILQQDCFKVYCQFVQEGNERKANPLLHRYSFWHINNRQFLTTLWEKKKELLKTMCEKEILHFPFFPLLFVPYRRQDSSIILAISNLSECAFNLVKAKILMFGN